MSLPLSVSTPCPLAGCPHDTTHSLSYSFYLLPIFCLSVHHPHSPPWFPVCFSHLLGFLSLHRTLCPDTCLSLPIFPVFALTLLSFETSHPTPTFWSSLWNCPLSSYVAQSCLSPLALPQLCSPAPSSLGALPSASLPVDLRVSEWPPGGGEPLPRAPAVEWEQGLAGRVHHCAQCHPE